MRIGVPKESKNNEFRVGLTPPSVRELIDDGHEVFVETNAGRGIGAADRVYQDLGARVVDSTASVFEAAELIVKVKEPNQHERSLLSSSHVLFTYLHLAPDPQQAAELVQSGATCIAYETVELSDGSLPLLKPMSEVAGRMSVTAAARSLERPSGGAGVLMGGVAGVQPAHVVVLGAGVVGSEAAAMSIGLGARVTVLDRNVDALRRLDARFGNRLQTLYSTRDAIQKVISTADAVISGVLVPGASAPKLISRNMISQMQKGSVVVDVAIDQGGSFETSMVTTHEAPTYEVDGVVHYCVGNMPGAVPRSSSSALNNVTLPYVRMMAAYGVTEALQRSQPLMKGLNVCRGRITHPAVAESLATEFTEPHAALAG